MSIINPTKLPRKHSWFLTDIGRRFSFSTICCTNFAIFAGHVLPQTMFVTQYKDYVRLYSKGFTVPVPEILLQRFEKTLDLLKIQNPDRARYEPFMACGFDIFSFGTHGRFGVHLGLPVNFKYTSVENIDKSKIKVNQLSVIWETPEGQKLLNSLIVPESAQLYAIAREIKMRDSWKFFYDTTYAIAAFLATYTFSSALNRRFNLYNKPTSVRVCSYTLIGLINLTYYLMCKDFTQNLMEDKIDRELKEMDPVFAEGGKEYYSKILERNQALRVLMGKEGENMYTILGNENYLFRNKHRPLVQRKEFFELKEETA